MMFIQDPDPKVKKVDDLDFYFMNGKVLQYTLDPEAGDWKETPTPDTLVLHFAPGRDSDLLPVPAEDVTIYLKNLTHIVHISREVTELTHSQHEEWQKTLQEMTTKTVQ